ncbi:toll/interleukin-1 receptor domain-containing protein [Chitinophaga lutea]
MANHVSQIDLEVFYKQEKKSRGARGIQEVVNAVRINDDLNATSRKIIFLSHSHLDRTIVDKIVLLFNKVNISVYVDWLDGEMPKYTNKETAAQIKQKIESADKFLFLATYNALRSKWCNWELGIAFSKKYNTDFAILPIEAKSGRWTGNEYLQLYPEMQFDLSKGIEGMQPWDISIRIDDSRILGFENWINI